MMKTCPWIFAPRFLVVLLGATATMFVLLVRPAVMHGGHQTLHPNIDSRQATNLLSEFGHVPLHIMTPNLLPSKHTTGKHTTHFAHSDCHHLQNLHWPVASCNRMPRVLISTWCTENLLEKFKNEVYWKSCYAHTHGFDVDFTGRRMVSGVKPYTGNVTGGEAGWYSDENMWGWVPSVRQQLASGQYDYVFVMGGDTLIMTENLDFPIWAYDRGHDITVMDQPASDYGLNENAFLLRASDWTLMFLDTFYAHRKNFNLQGDNGPWMETLLTFLGREAETARRPGYNDSCLPILVLDKPCGVYMKDDQANYQTLNSLYSECFFKELDRLAGPYGMRSSKHIGFSNTQRNDSLPWANCWNEVQYGRPPWEDWPNKCFALHWSGTKYDAAHNVSGECPDPSFAWDTSRYNIDNAMRGRYK